MNAPSAAPRSAAEDSLQRDAVVIVSEAGARKICARELRFKDAAGRGLVIIDADEPPREALDGHDGPPTRVGLSRFASHEGPWPSLAARHERIWRHQMHPSSLSLSGFTAFAGVPV